MNTQLRIPLFSADIFDKVRSGHCLNEIVKLQKEVEHLKHVKAGYMGAMANIKKKRK